MLKKTLSVIIFQLLFVSSALASILMGPIVNPDNNHTYILLDQSNWTDAEAEAVSLGGHLVTVNSAEEQDWLLSVFSPSRDRHLWIGLNDAAVEGEFIWSSGEPSTYLNFPVGEPNNANGIEDYVYIDVAHSDAWNDLADITEQLAPSGDYISLHGVVEFNQAFVPLPAAGWLFASGLTLILALRKTCQKGS